MGLPYLILSGQKNGIVNVIYNPFADKGSPFFGSNGKNQNVKDWCIANGKEGFSGTIEKACEFFGLSIE